MEQNEICVEGRLVVQHAVEGYCAFTAWCVEIKNFISLAKLLKNEKSTGASVQTNFHAAMGKHYSVAAVLAARDEHTSLNAQGLETQAQTADMIGNSPVWRTLNAGESQCSDCASFGIRRIPEKIQRIKTHLELKPGTVTGSLFLASLGT